MRNDFEIICDYSSYQINYIVNGLYRGISEEYIRVNDASSSGKMIESPVWTFAFDAINNLTFSCTCDESKSVITSKLQFLLPYYSTIYSLFRHYYVIHTFFAHHLLFFTLSKQTHRLVVVFVLQTFHHLKVFVLHWVQRMSSSVIRKHQSHKHFQWKWAVARSSDNSDNEQR